VTDRLAILADGRVMGEIRRDKRSRLTLVYDAAWRRTANAYPLSLSMPLVVDEHGHDAVTPWLWGLLPDNEIILDGWGRRFQVSPRNPFALLAHVGEDCAGAIQLVEAARVEALLTRSVGDVEWLDDKGVADRLRRLREDHAAWRIPGDAGQFSLAGAQPKTALLLSGDRWGVPSGSLPTTHILKPPTEGLDGHAENEHVCLALARALGLPAATSQVRRFNGETAIVVERYDRARSGNTIHRLHQEDMCQALGLPPTRKYENQRGPGAQPIVELLRTHSGRPLDDIRTFLQALAFNWLIAGTDAHAKNYSVLIGGGGRARLAPLYDLGSALAHEGLDPRKLKLAMRIADRYALEDIGLAQWSRLASALRVDAEQLRLQCLDLAETLPEALTDVLKAARREGLRHKVLRRLADALHDRAARCRKILAGA
jgi:serine/threonine-protein kinase HipA